MWNLRSIAAAPGTRCAPLAAALALLGILSMHGWGTHARMHAETSNAPAHALVVDDHAHQAGTRPARPPAPLRDPLLTARNADTAPLARRTALSEAASGAELDRLFLTIMIEHEVAIEMAKTEQEDGEFPDAVSLAEDIDEAQTSEIVTMTELLGS